MKYYLILFFIVPQLILNAQSSPNNINNNTRTILSNTKIDDLASRGDYRMQNAFLELVSRINKNKYIDETNVSGSKYFINNFLLGKVYFNTKPNKNMFALRYNAYLDLIEVQKENTIETLIKSVNLSCSINNQVYVYQKYIPKKNKKRKFGYLKILYKGKNTTLFVKESVIFKEAKPAKNSIVASFNAKFVPYENYFFLDNRSKTIALPITKKSILNELGNTSKIKSFIKEERISFKKKEDLIKLFLYHDSISTNVK